jgi:hypothetical protein
MPDRDKLAGDLDGLRRYGVLLAVQMGGTPEEIQLLIETAELDEAAGGLRRMHNYVIRALGVREHQISVGLFGRLAFIDDHPLLYHHNTPRVAVTFDGAPRDINEAILDIQQAYISTFTIWRHLVMTGDLNTTQPLDKLLAKTDTDGSKLLGVMPRPLAERIGRVLEHHGLPYQLTPDPDWAEADEHGRSHLSKLLLIDNGHIVALDFSVEQMGKPKT